MRALCGFIKIGEGTIAVDGSITFKNPRWYRKESAAAELERTARQVI
jgi:hypothetical protein